MITAATTRIASISSLHPIMRSVATGIYQDMLELHQANRLQFRFEIFETLRLPQRQDDAFSRSTSKARAWQSAHQFGLAFDMVPYLTTGQARELLPKGSSIMPGWHWPSREHSDWDILTDIAENYGMVTLAWDRPHVEHPLFSKVEEILSDEASFHRHAKA